MQFIPSLTFNGNCQEALIFYAELFGGEIGAFIPWDATTVANTPEATEDHIMNGSINVNGYTILGSDQFGDMYSPAGNMSLMVELEDVTNAQAKFAALSKGGQSWMPFDETFWADGYGFCTDRFGVMWQISFMGSKAQPA